jgi:hypothetical protein
MHPAILVAMSEVMTVVFVYDVFRLAASRVTIRIAMESLMKKCGLIERAFRLNL